jgi:hypothetical protein
MFLSRWRMNDDEATEVSQVSRRGEEVAVNVELTDLAYHSCMPMTTPQEDDPHSWSPVNPVKSSTRGWSSKKRVYVLREFLWDVYRDHLSSATTDSVILDVAGGKGDLSWLLENVDDLPSIVVDPRLPNNHLVKSVEWLRVNPEEATLRAATPGDPDHQPLAKFMPKLKEKDSFVVRALFCSNLGP